MLVVLLSGAVTVNMAVPKEAKAAEEKCYSFVEGKKV